MTSTIERRFTSGSLELRAEGGPSSRLVRGYAAKYKTKSENLGSRSYEFYEVIEPGAFDDVLQNDVRALFNHDANQILARSKGGEGTLKLGVDDIVLRLRAIGACGACRARSRATRLR